MLEIQVDNNILELPEDFSLMLELRNPMFNDIGDFSFPFQILATVNNQAFLGFPERKNNNNSAIEFDTKVYFSHYLFLTGTSVFMKYIMQNGKKYYYLKFLLSRGNFNFLAKKNLRDVDYGDEIDLGSTQADVLTAVEGYVANQYPEVDCNFPMVSNSKFYDQAVNADWGASINAYNRVAGAFYENTISDELWAPDNITTLVPYPYLFFILKKALNDIGFNYSGDFWLHEELSTLIVHNNFALDEKIKKYFVDVTSAATPYAIPVATTQTIVLDNEIKDDDNCFNAGTYIYTVQNKGYHEINIKIKITGTGNTTCHVYRNGASLNSQLLTNGYYTEYNYTFYHDGAANFLLWVALYSINGCTLDDVEVQFNNTSYCNLSRLTKNINFQNHVPGMSINDIVKAIEFPFGFRLFPDNINKEVKLLFLKDLLSSIDYIELTDECDGQVSQDFDNEKTFKINFEWSGDDDRVRDNFLDYSEYEYLGEYTLYTDLPTIDKVNLVALVKNVNWIYISKVDSTGNYYFWSYLTDNFLEYLYNDTFNFVEITPGFSPLLMRLVHHPVNADYITPIILQKGTSTAFETGINEFAFRLLFYRGKTYCYDEDGQPYPLGSTMRFDGLGDNHGDIELRWDGDYGLVETFLKNYLYWYVFRRRRAYANIRFSISQIAHLEFWKKIRILEKYYFLDVIKLTIDKNMVHVAQCSLFTV